MMRWVDKIGLRLRSLFHGSRVEQEMADELRFHLEQQIEENLAAGMTPEQAPYRSEEHTSELQSQSNLVCRLLLEKKKNTYRPKRSSRPLTSGAAQAQFSSHPQSTETPSPPARVTHPSRPVTHTYT